MSALTRVAIEESITVYTDVTFKCPREIAELYKTLSEGLTSRVDIEEVKKVSDFDREYGIEEPGTYMIWEEEDGTKKNYKVKNYSREEVDSANYEIDEINLYSLDDEE